MPQPRRPIFVHLGNLGIGRNIKTEGYARRFKDVQFVGIDLTEHKGSRPHNWRQIQADFASGLERLEDKSVDHISSELALGMYLKDGDRFGGRPRYKSPEYNFYAVEVLNVAYRKLKEGGKIRFVVGDERDVIRMLACIYKTSFSREKISVRKIPENERKRTPWMRILDVVFHEITIEK